MLNKILAILEKLIAFDTTSYKSNLACISYIQSYLELYGIESHLVHNADKTKANLLCTIGPKQAGGIILSGHLDVVPVEGQHWDSNPFALTKRDDLFYGRGTADMKSFIAICLAAVPELLKSPQSYHFIFSYDEEVGCQGVPSAIEYFTIHFPQARFALIGEPTEMKVITAHKSITGYQTEIQGTASHSSHGDVAQNAIVTGSRIIEKIDTICTKLQKEQNSDFTPPHMTYNIGKIHGGQAINITAEACEIEWETRLLPGQDMEKHILIPLQKFESSLTATCHTSITCSAPALADQDNDDVKSTIMQVTGNNQSYAVAFATEAGLFQQANIPAIVCGPGSIEQAHKPNEFISEEQLGLGIRMIEKLSNNII